MGGALAPQRPERPAARRMTADAAPERQPQTEPTTPQEEAGVPRYLGSVGELSASEEHGLRAAGSSLVQGTHAAAVDMALAQAEQQTQALGETDEPLAQTIENPSGQSARGSGPNRNPEAVSAPLTPILEPTPPVEASQKPSAGGGSDGDGAEDGTPNPAGEDAQGSTVAGSGAASGAGAASGGAGAPGAGGARGATGGGGNSGSSVSPAGPEGEALDTAEPQDATTAETAGLAAMGLGDLVLIDTELAEHQRWGAAAAHVGAAGSDQRAAFVLEQAGSGFLTGAGSGFGTGLAIGVGTRLASKAVPVLGPIIGAGLALHGLVTGWDAATESVSKFGEGNDTYEVLANSIEAISQIINVVSGVLNIINSVVSIVEIAAGVVAAGGAVAAVLTLGAAAPVVAIALEVVAACQEISGGITIVTSVLDDVNQIILQPSVTLFRALHTFTSQADPRDVETQGQQINAAAAASGGALGGVIGGELAQVGGGTKPPPKEEQAPPPRETPPAKGEPPAVHFDEPPAAGRPGAGEAGPASAPQPQAEPTQRSPVFDPNQPAAPPSSVPSVEPFPNTKPSPGVEPPPPRPAPAPEAPPPAPAPKPDVPEVPPTQRSPGVEARPQEPVGAAAPERPVAPQPGEHPAAPSEPVRIKPPSEPATPSGPTEHPFTPNGPTPLPEGPGGTPEIPRPAKVPSIEHPNYGPGLPDWRPEPSTYTPTQRPTPPEVPSEPATTPWRAPNGPAESMPARSPAVPEELADTHSTYGIEDEQLPASPRSADEKCVSTPQPVAPTTAAAPVELLQLELPGTEPGKRGPRRPLSPDEVVPPDAHSAWLRRLRAEAEGRPAPTEPGGGPYNVARHHVPGRDTAHPNTPTPDFYQKSPRTPGEQSHHLEQQALLRDRVRTFDDGTTARTGIAGYDPKEDPTVMMPRQQHESLRAPQTQQETPDIQLQTTLRALGTPASTEEAVNIASHGQRATPPEGTPATMVPEPVAGQTAAEHLSYLFSLSPLSEPTLPRSSPAQVNEPVGPRPLARDVAAPHGTPMGYEDINWEGTFNQPDPYALAQPPGTQLDFFGNHQRPQAPLPEQHSLPLPKPGDPRQTAFDFSIKTAASPEYQGAPPSPQSHRPGEVLPVEEPSPATGRRSARSEEPLSNADKQASIDDLLDMGVPRDQVKFGDRTSYNTKRDVVTVGPNVNPLPPEQRPLGLANPANAAAERRAVLGHEALGHREAKQAGQTRTERWHEELQASVRAALLDPKLSPEQRQILIQDAAARRRIAPNDDTIFVWTERYQPPRQRRAPRDDTHAAGAPRTPEQFRPQDQLPSVIIDHEALGMTPPAGVHQARASEPQPSAAARAAAPQEQTPAAPRTAPPERPPAISISAAPGRTTAAASTAQQPSEGPDGAPATQSPTWGTRLEQVGQFFRPHVLGIGDPEAPKPEEVEAQQRKQYTADNQPAKGVERVNPDYPPPPGTPQQVEAMQQEISRLLAEKARAEQEAALQSSRADQCEANQGPIQQTVDDTTQGISAAQAHQQSVAAHDAANQAQQQRQQESQGLVAGYPSKAAGLAVLGVPLAAWQGFTSLASHLPGDAGTKMLQMNEDANKMQSAFVNMGAQMVGIDGQQPARQAELQGDAGRLDATATQAQGTQADLRTAQAGAQGLQQANSDAKSEAETLRDNATQQGQQLGDQADKKQEAAKTLSEQMQAWAVAHKAARQQAIEATKNRLQAQGKVNVRTTEHA